MYKPPKQANQSRCEGTFFRYCGNRVGALVAVCVAKIHGKSSQSMAVMAAYPKRLRGEEVNTWYKLGIRYHKSFHDHIFSSYILSESEKISPQSLWFHQTGRGHSNCCEI